jgi:hypothetical protein
VLPPTTYALPAIHRLAKLRVFFRVEAVFDGLKEAAKDATCRDRTRQRIRELHAWRAVLSKDR